MKKLIIFIKRIILQMPELLPISADRVHAAIDQAPDSNIAKSVRRIYFTGLNEPAETRGYWHTDIMAGMGSGILIKNGHNYFLLTARHVLKDLLDYRDNNGEFPNESPFWIDVKHRPRWESLYDFLMPKRIWEIGELITEEGLASTSDVVLVELFPPGPAHLPDHFIDVADSSLFCPATTAPRSDPSPENTVRHWKQCTALRISSDYV